ncbi:hypothetical protein [Candidatus Venteria ishoeyi]|uniref:hypothetical protein n=1 Tax=Candidatus Venteria ishoeyi TaxID=1899563 RepID=UPI0011B0E5E1|nr:hypothetical protein [Candidatus Venteria ishoeyi]MDM8548108.1 hypothetical protein [Candidatus Venteria ishoeyi]
MTIHEIFSLSQQPETGVVKTSQIISRLFSHFLFHTPRWGLIRNKNKLISSSKDSKIMMIFTIPAKSCWLKNPLKFFAEKI